MFYVSVVANDSCLASMPTSIMVKELFMHTDKVKVSKLHN